MQISLFGSRASWEEEAEVRRRLERNLLTGGRGTTLYMPDAGRDRGCVAAFSHSRGIALSETSIASTPLEKLATSVAMI